MITRNQDFPRIHTLKLFENRGWQAGSRSGIDLRASKLAGGRVEDRNTYRRAGIESGQTQLARPIDPFRIANQAGCNHFDHFPLDQTPTRRSPSRLSTCSQIATR